MYCPNCGFPAEIDLVEYDETTYCCTECGYEMEVSG